MESKVELEGTLERELILTGSFQSSNELSGSATITATMYSAYDVAVANGFTGTVSEWLFCAGCTVRICPEHDNKPFTASGMM